LGQFRSGERGVPKLHPGFGVTRVGKVEHLSGKPLIRVRKTQLIPNKKLASKLPSLRQCDLFPLDTR